MAVRIQHKHAFSGLPAEVPEVGTVTVADILANPQRFDFERLADPADPTYADDPRIAIFFANGGKARPHIFSHAHGGCKYVLGDLLPDLNRKGHTA